MKTLTLTMLDYDDISHLIIAAMADGATSANIPGDPDNFHFTFEKAASANAFEKAVAQHIAERGDKVEASDPVDDGDAAE